MVVLAGMLWLSTSRAADEDSTTSVYLEFDPKTGEFVTVEDFDRSKQRAEDQNPNHFANELDTDTGAAPHAGQPRAGLPAAHAQAGGGASTSVIVASGVAVAALLLGGALFWIRRRNRKTP